MDDGCILAGCPDGTWRHQPPRPKPASKRARRWTCPADSAMRAMAAVSVCVHCSIATCSARACATSSWNRSVSDLRGRAIRRVPALRRVRAYVRACAHVRHGRAYRRAARERLFVTSRLPTFPRDIARAFENRPRENRALRAVPSGHDRPNASAHRVDIRVCDYCHAATIGHRSRKVKGLSVTMYHTTFA